MSLIRKHVAVLQAWACLALVLDMLGSLSLYALISLPMSSIMSTVVQVQRVTVDNSTGALKRDRERTTL